MRAFVPEACGDTPCEGGREVYAVEAAYQHPPLPGLSEVVGQETTLFGMGREWGYPSDWVEKWVVEVAEPGLFYRLVCVATQAVPCPHSQQRPLRNCRGGAGEESGLLCAGQKHPHGEQRLGKPLWGEALCVGDIHRPGEVTRRFIIPDIANSLLIILLFYSVFNSLIYKEIFYGKM